MAFSLVRSLVKHTLKYGGNALGGGVVPIGSIASAVYQEWCASGEKPAKDQAPPAAEQARVRLELEKILQDARGYRAQVDQLLGELGAGQPEAVRQAARSYLNQVPGRVQQSLRRAEDPSGRTIPAGLLLRRAEDLQQLLPERMPRFQPGARPVPGTDLVIEELLGVGGFGEVWKASHQSRPHLPPVALKFCVDETAARTLRKEVELLDRVSQQGRHRGIVELRYAHLEGKTPCLEYEYVDGGDLACLVTDLHRAGKAPPLTMTRLFYSLAQAVGFAHRIKPPIVHRDLKPTNVLTTRIEKRVVLKILDFGIGGIAADQAKRTAAETVGQGTFTESAGTCTPLYASPQQRRGAGPDPRDDVYALGVIWYQMLVGDVTKEPPRGGSWKKRLLDQGTTPSTLALLERCLEDDPADRPADAQVLAQELQVVIKEAAPEAGAVAGPPDSVSPKDSAGPVADKSGARSQPASAPTGIPDARRLVKKPAIALLVAGGLGLAVSLIAIAASIGEFLSGPYVPYPYKSGKEPIISTDASESQRQEQERQRRYESDANLRAYRRHDEARALFLTSHFFAGAAGVAIWAGLCMRRLRRYWLCMVGSIAVLPALVGSIFFLSVMAGAYLLLLVGIPLGVWLLLTLRKAEVRSAFS
jgi:serine/threonine protein kinase